MSMIEQIDYDEDEEEFVTLRQAALAMAIEAKCGQTYDGSGNMIFSDVKFVDAAMKFYNFLKEITNENVQTNRN